MHILQKIKLPLFLYFLLKTLKMEGPYFSISFNYYNEIVISYIRDKACILQLNTSFNLDLRLQKHLVVEGVLLVCYGAKARGDCCK